MAREYPPPGRISVTAWLGKYQEDVPPFTCDLCKKRCETFGDRNGFPFTLDTAKRGNLHELFICATCGCSLSAGDTLAKLEL